MIQRAPKNPHVKPTLTDTQGVGSVIVLCGRLVGAEGFELDRPEHSQAGMSPFGVVSAFYPFEDGVGKFAAGFPGSCVKDFELQGSPE
jgi:hypothetical protein